MAILATCSLQARSSAGRHSPFGPLGIRAPLSSNTTTTTSGGRLQVSPYGRSRASDAGSPVEYDTRPSRGGEQAGPCRIARGRWWHTDPATHPGVAGRRDREEAAHARIAVAVAVLATVPPAVVAQQAIVNLIATVTTSSAAVAKSTESVHLSRGAYVCSTSTRTKAPGRLIPTPGR